MITFIARLIVQLVEYLIKHQIYDMEYENMQSITVN